jgi:glycosyltransferase involved in cell wall biosynthesis
MNLPSTMPLQSAYSYLPQMKKELAQLSSNGSFDIIHVEHIRAGYMLPTNRSIPALYDSVDCITSLYKRFRTEQSSMLRKFIATIESKKLTKSEPYVLSKYDAIITTTTRDKHYLNALSHNTKHSIPKISVISNGVDTDYFRPQNISLETYSIVFTGKMAYYANELAAIHFAQEIFPIVKSKIPTAKLYIVGARPSTKIQQLEKNEGIAVTGWVPDIRLYLSLAHVVVCPVRVAVGIQNKLLEAMSMAKAIVTYVEPTIALQPSHDNIFLVANNPKQFGENIIELMNNESLRKRLATNAQFFVKKFYSWDHNVQKLQKVYHRTIETFAHECSQKKS